MQIAYQSSLKKAKKLSCCQITTYLTYRINPHFKLISYIEAQLPVDSLGNTTFCQTKYNECPNNFPTLSSEEKSYFIY